MTRGSIGAFAGVAIGLALAASGHPAVAAEPETSPNTLALGVRAAGEEDFAFMAIQVSDMNKALSFYKAVMGFTEQFRDVTTTQVRVGVDFPSNKKGPRVLLLQDKDQAGVPEKGKVFNRYCFYVKDVNAVVQELGALGLPVRGPTDLKASGVKIVFSKDFDGNTIEFMEKY